MFLFYLKNGDPGCLHPLHNTLFGDTQLTQNCIEESQGKYHISVFLTRLRYQMVVGDQPSGHPQETHKVKMTVTILLKPPSSAANLTFYMPFMQPLFPQRVKNCNVCCCVLFCILQPVVSFIIEFLSFQTTRSGLYEKSNLRLSRTSLTYLDFNSLDLIFCSKRKLNGESVPTMQKVL